MAKFKEPKQTVKAYKLFRVDQRQPGKLFPLFVHANQPVELDKWHEAQIGEMTGDKVKSKIGPLAFRPGWHAGDLPIATHIGEKSDSSLTAPDTRPANHVWAEVEMPDDVDWQSVANERGTNAKGRVVPVKAHITDQIPAGGHYRYKTNSNMTGNWLIGGAMKVNKVLNDKEVKAINKAAGVSDLPRAQPFSAKKFGFAGGGSVSKLVIPDHVKNEEIANYRDPKTTKIADWKWRKLKEVLTDVPLTEVPDYIQKGYGEFMNQQLSKAQAGQLTPRDLLKAFTITQSSIGRGGLSHASATKTGMKLPNTGEEVRPEGAFAEWLGSSMGQKYLNAAERGLIHHPALGDIQQKFAPFGKHNQLVDQMAYAAQMMPKLAQTMNQAVTGGKDEYRDWAEQMRGIAGAKSGFIGSMLGRGDLPTLDARQLNLHTLPANVGVGSIMSRGKGTGAREAVDRLASRQQAMNLNVDPSMMPHYQHLTHHAVWDAMGKNKTTHDDLVRAMRGYAEGGAARMAKGGNPTVEEMRRAIAKASGSNPPMAEKNLTNTQDFHTSLMDKVREGSINAKKQMDAFNYKYDKGHRVFTEDSAKKNKAPYEIIERYRHGNELMWEGEPWRSKKIIDPETGKAKRTPYVPGYRVRGEVGEMILPESAIKGRVDMARGGVVHMAKGGASIKELQEYILQKRGEFGAKRVQRAADEIPNLEGMFTPEALKHTFERQNAGLMTMNPADFEKFAERMREDITKKGSQRYTRDMERVPFDDYLKHLAELEGGFDEVPFLDVGHRDLEYLPSIEGHEGRHRSRALAGKGAKKSLVQLIPSARMSLSMPKRNSEKLVQKLRQTLGEDRFVSPEGGSLLPANKDAQMYKWLKEKNLLDANRPQLPDVYKRGGKVTHAHHLDIEERPL